jgi:hypothetical protein
MATKMTIEEYLKAAGGWKEETKVPAESIIDGDVYVKRSTGEFIAIPAGSYVDTNEFCPVMIEHGSKVWPNMVRNFAECSTPTTGDKTHQPGEKTKK